MVCTDDFCKEITWDKILWPVILIPLIFVVCLTGLLLLLRVTCWRVDDSLVDETMASSSGWFEIVLYAAQLVCSAISVMIWVDRTYTHTVGEDLRWVEVALSVFYIVPYVFRLKVSGFSFSYPLSIPALIDVFTVVPVFVWIFHYTEGNGFEFREASAIPWLSMSHLRVQRCVVAYGFLESTGALDEMSELKRAYFLTFLKAMSLVIILGGTVIFLEVLGDPEAFNYTPVNTEMGALSFVQIFYWIITTITTVGYGDFSPKTVFSQIFVIFCILYGVIFFSMESAAVIELRNKEDTGKGRFHPQPPRSDHVVLVGGGVANFSSIVSNFLNELYEREHVGQGSTFPNCVLMASTPKSPQLQACLDNLPPYARSRVQYFVGSVMQPHDLDRIRLSQASLAIIVCDVQTADPDVEDRENTVRALSMKRHVPNLNMRLLLLRPESKRNAVHVGIRSARCQSVNEMKSSLLAISTRCPGYPTLVSNLLHTGERKSPHGKELAPWVLPYMEGLHSRLTAFCVADHIDGKTWQDLVHIGLEQGIVPIAAQVEGHIILNPESCTLQGKDIVFAIVRDLSLLSSIANVEVDWRTIFTERQGNAAPRARVSEVRKVKPGTQTGATNESQAGETPKEKSKLLALPQFSAAHLLGGAPSAPPQQATARKVVKSKPIRGDMSKEDIEKMELAAERIAEGGGHILLVVLVGSIWQQVHTFISCSRARHLPYHDPIVVMTNEPPNRKVCYDLCESFENIGILIGSLLGNTDKERANAQNASSIILLAGRPLAEDWNMVDCIGTMSVVTLEHDKISCPTVLELLNEDSAKLLQLYKPSSNAIADMEELGDDNQNMQHSISAYGMALEGHQLGAEQHSMGFTFIHLPRFASGNLFSSSFLGAMCASSYYVPGVFELTEALTVGRGQTSFAWLVRPPRNMHGEPYRVLASWFFKGLSEEMGSAELLAIPLGIYRQQSENAEHDTNHVIINPDMDLVLSSTDRAYVLASERYGRACAARGLLAFPSVAWREEDSVQMAL